MKSAILIFAGALLLLFSCTNSERVPKAPQNADEAKKLIFGNNWQLRDIAVSTKSSAFEKPGDKAEYAFLSEAKDLDDNTKNELEKHQGTKFEISADGSGKAFIESLGLYGKQSFSVSETDGITLQLKADSAMFGSDMMHDVTYSYKVLGVSDKKLFVQTPNQVNNKRVYFLFENGKQ